MHLVHPPQQVSAKSNAVAPDPENIAPTPSRGKEEDVQPKAETPQKASSGGDDNLMTQPAPAAVRVEPGGSRSDLMEIDRGPTTGENTVTSRASSVPAPVVEEATRTPASAVAEATETSHQPPSQQQENERAGSTVDGMPSKAKLTNQVLPGVLATFPVCGIRASCNFLCIRN